MAKGFVYFVVFFALSAISIFPQIDRQSSNLVAGNNKKKCRDFLTGKLLNNPQPVYPKEAKIAGVWGKVEVAIEVDENGKVYSSQSISGNSLLKKSAAEAALRAKFSPTLCDGIPTKHSGLIIYNYPKIVLTDEYFRPAKPDDFIDVTEDKSYYHAVLQLVSDYKIAFGYADQKFHGEMPLTRGDFAHFLRLMLERLEWRGKFSNRPINDIGLFQIYNPHGLKRVATSAKTPFAESLNVLSEKYGIVLNAKDGNFDSQTLPTKGEIIKIWGDIFGAEAVPIHFSDNRNYDREMSRGDFAIYLKESLDVLSYKVSP